MTDYFKHAVHYAAAPLAILFCLLIMTHCSQTENPLLKEFQTVHNTAPFSKIKNEHYLPAFKQAISMGKQDLQNIKKNPEGPNFENTIVAMDNAGDLLEQVSGVFYNLLSAETNEVLQQVAEEISPELTKFSNEMYLDEVLYQRVKQVYEKRESLNLNQEQQTLLQKTYKAFQDNGATLQGEDKQRFKQIAEELSLLSLKFGDNVRLETNKFQMHLTDMQDLAGLPEAEVEAAAMKAKAKKLEGWLVDLSYPSYGPFMKYADKRELRKELYVAYNTKGLHGDSLDNQQNIKKIAALRYEMAQLLGYKNYAAYTLEDRMAKNEKNVWDLLNTLKDNYKNLAKKDIQEVQDYAQSIGFNGKLQAWDLSYYSDKLKQSKYSLNDELLKPYFELESVKQGVFSLANDLWGLQFVENKEIEVYHEDVTAYDVLDKDGSFLAVFYADYFPREGKRGGAWMNNFREQKIQNGQNIRPHIVNVMNFTMPTETKPSLLSFSEVTTLLHEFGHALHGMLANTTYAGLSGTNVDRDFVELPSQMLENYAYEKEFLDKFAKHYKTGETIPQELIDKIIRSNNFMAGYLCYRQLSFGFLDMHWHSLSKFDQNLDVIDFENEAQKEVELLPVEPGTAVSGSFSHIFSGGYAAGYYGYKWAEVLDADAFAVFKKAGIYDTKTAQAFRENILERGGTQDPMELYEAFKGAKPTIEALLARDGIQK